MLPSCHRHERLGILKRFSAFKNLWEKLYVNDIKKKKEEAETKSSFCDLENALTGTIPRLVTL